MLQRILKGSPERSSNSNSKGTQVPSITGDQPLNPFTEIQILSHHTDIIKFLVAIDEQRCATGGDDKQIVIWDVHFGKKLHVLNGHSRPLTALKCHVVASDQSRKTHILISAASDKLICLWNVNTGHCFKTLTEHACTARDFSFFPDCGLSDYFCSSGENLCLWNKQGKLVDRVHCSDDDIQKLVILRPDRILGSVNKNIAVFELDGVGELNEMEELKIKHVKDLNAHRESVTVLLRVNEVSFASGSLDGTIVLWSTQNLTRMKYLYKPSDYQGSNRLYPYSVQQMICLDERFVVSAIGSGFSIFDAITKRCIAGVASAHYSKVLHLELVFGGLLLATCSEDGSIRLWGNSMSFDSSAVKLEENIENQSDDAKEMFSKLDTFLGLKPEPTLPRNDKADGEKTKYSPELLGECLGHTGAVQLIHCLETEGFVSCGKDGIVIAWKDGRRQEMRRNEILRDLLYGASADFN